MGKPKKRTSSRKTGLRRSHLFLKLARAVNAKSPVKVRTTKNESGSKKVKTAEKKIIKAVAKADSKAKPATKKKSSPKKG